MELISCVPYIRFAGELCFESQRGPSRTYDCRALYVLHGNAQVRFDGKNHPGVHGALILFQPGTEYVILPSPSVTMAVLDFDFTQEYSQTTEFLVPCPAAGFHPEQAHRHIQLSDVPALNTPLYLENAVFLEAGLQEIISEFSQKRLFFRGKTSTIFKNLLFEIARALQPGNDPRGTVDRVLDYIEHNLTRPLTNREIGEALNYNPNYLNRLILRHTGMSLHQYLLQRRLTLAAGLIQSTDRPIGEIALELGFHSPSHFSNYFKKATGLTPAQFRQHSPL